MYVSKMNNVSMDNRKYTIAYMHRVKQKVLNFAEADDFDRIKEYIIFIVIRKILERSECLEQTGLV